MRSNADYRIVRLQNGMQSVHSLSHCETFHPVIGPAAEAQALYVEQLNLAERLTNHQGEFVVWDVGLGAAANALTLLQATRKLSCSIRLISFDQTLEPLRFGLRHAGTLGYFHGHEQQIQALLEKHRVTFQHAEQQVEWALMLGDFPSLLAAPSARSLPKPHVIMFDPYSPAKNPAMWTLPLFTNLFRLLDPERPCALPTYSRSTMLRVTLLLAGFFVGVGHATGEKEETTIAANAIALIPERLDSRWLKRARHSSSAQPMEEPAYKQRPLSTEIWEMLNTHPQFTSSNRSV